MKMQNITVFKDEAEAYKQIEEEGYFVFQADYPAVENDFHWHDFDSLIYITAGELTVTEQATGDTAICGPGSKIIGSAGVVHREKSDGYSAILGLSVDPRSLTQPVEKPPIEAG
jgi:quercetin dioxygenase-like cupin family protein